MTMHSRAPDPWNVNDERWRPPPDQDTIRLVTRLDRDDTIVVYEPGVGTPAPYIKTAAWYSLSDWQ